MKTKLNQSKIKLAIATAIIAGSMGLSATSYAATAHDNMLVFANVAMVCTVESGQLNFNTYDPTSASDSLGTAVITSVCTNGGSAKITANQGASPATGSTDAVPLRRLHNSSDNTKLAYSVWQNTARDVIWGGTPATGIGFTANDGETEITVYGKIEAGLTATSGSYADSVSVTITY